MTPDDFDSLPVAGAGRSPPHSDEAEQVLLSCCMIEGSDAIARCLDAKVSSAAFYLPANAIIYDALISLFSDNLPTSLEVLIEVLKGGQQLEAIGGIAYLMKVSARMPTTAQAGFFINRAKKLHTLRELIKISTSAVERAFANTGEVDDLVASVTNEILGLQTDGNSSAMPWDKAIDAAVADTARLAESDAPLPGELTWGFDDLDRYFGKPQVGQLVVIGGRPSTGKSSMARQIAIANARKGDGVLFLTLEVRAKRVALSMAQTRSGVSFKEIQQRRASEADIRLFIESLKALKGIPGLQVCEDPVITAGSVAARVRAAKARKPIKLVVIDQLNLMSDAVGSHGVKLTEAIARVTRSLKIMANTEEVCVLLLSQLNRESAYENSEPALHQLRDSGMVEADADKVVFLHRPKKNPLTEMEQDENARVEDQPTWYENSVQAKGRDDGTSRVGLYFTRRTATFAQIAKQR